MKADHKIYFNMDKYKVFMDPRISKDTVCVWATLLKNLQPDNCSEITQLDVPFTKKRLEVALKSLKKLKIIRSTTKEYSYMCNPEYVLYDKEKQLEYTLKFIQPVITVQRRN